MKLSPLTLSIQGKRRNPSPHEHLFVRIATGAFITLTSPLWIPLRILLLPFRCRVPVIRFLLIFASLLGCVFAMEDLPCCTICKCKVVGSAHKACGCAASCTCGPIRRNDGTALDNVYFRMMDTMMGEMAKVPYQGTVGRNFLAQMIAHHSGAVEMAKHHIACGKNQGLLQLSKSILVEQEYQIRLMEIMLAQMPSDRSKTAEAYQNAMRRTMDKMMETLPTDEKLLEDPDRSFAAIMLPHHEAAIDMALTVLQFSPEETTATLAREIIANQQAEVLQMHEFLKTPNAP